MTQATKGATRAKEAAGGAASLGLQDSLQKLAETLTQRAVTSASSRLTGATDRLSDYAQSGGGSGLLAAVTGAQKLAGGESPMKAALSAGMAGAKGKVKEGLKGITGLFGGKGKGGGKKIKLTNIVEYIDVGVPIDLAYKQWTQFAEFPKFMKKVEQVEQLSDEKLRWKAQVFLSHRSWESTITEQVPNDRIVWRSKGDKGYVDGAVTFHELAPNLTRVVVVLEYHPQGLFERTGNLWRAQGRRVRLELKHFQRNVMTHAVLHADEVEGWPGEIREGKVVDTGESEDGEESTRDTGEKDDSEDNEESTRTRRRNGSKAAASTRQRTADRSGRSRRGDDDRPSRRQAATKAEE